MKFTRKIIALSVLISMFAWHALSQDNNVRQTLQSYKVGTTKFVDFKKDAGLVSVNNTYGISTNSIWKLFWTKQNTKFIFGKFSQEWTYTVGDSGGPICKLGFDADGNLTDISFITEKSVLLSADQADDDAIDLVMEKLENTYKTGDYSYSFEILYTPILQSMGGKEAVAEAVKLLETQMQEQQISIVSWKAKKPYKYIAGEIPNLVGGGVRKYAIIPYESDMTIAGKKLTQKSYLLGIKITDSDWQFVNGDQLKPEIYQKFFPDFPKIVKLPETERVYE